VDAKLSPRYASPRGGGYASPRASVGAEQHRVGGENRTPAAAYLSPRSGYLDVSNEHEVDNGDYGESVQEMLGLFDLQAEEAALPQTPAADRESIHIQKDRENIHIHKERESIHIQKERGGREQASEPSDTGMESASMHGVGALQAAVLHAGRSRAAVAEAEWTGKSAFLAANRRNTHRVHGNDSPGAGVLSRIIQGDAVAVAEWSDGSSPRAAHVHSADVRSVAYSKSPRSPRRSPSPGTVLVCFCV
jgi:hypothetical protein